MVALNLRERVETKCLIWRKQEEEKLPYWKKCYTTPLNQGEPLEFPSPPYATTNKFLAALTYTYVKQPQHLHVNITSIHAHTTANHSTNIP